MKFKMKWQSARPTPGRALHSGQRAFFWIASMSEEFGFFLQ